MGIWWWFHEMYRFPSNIMHFPSLVPQVAWAIIFWYQFPADSFLYKKKDIRRSCQAVPAWTGTMALRGEDGVLLFLARSMIMMFSKAASIIFCMKSWVNKRRPDFKKQQIPHPAALSELLSFLAGLRISPDFGGHRIFLMNGALQLRSQRLGTHYCCSGHGVI